MTISTQAPRYTRAQLKGKTVSELRTMVRDIVPPDEDRLWITGATKSALIRTLLAKSENPEETIPERLVEGLRIVSEEFAKMLAKSLTKQIKGANP